MADVMQFIRELFEDASTSVGLQGMITHAIQIQDLREEDPALFLLQADIEGYLYSDMVMTRDPNLLEIKEGSQVLFQIPVPGTEGYPAFILMNSVKVPSVPLPTQPPQPPPQQVVTGATGPVPPPPAPHAPQAPLPPIPPAPIPPVPPLAQPGQTAVQAQGAHVVQPGDKGGVGSFDVDQEVPAPQFDPNARDQKRVDQK